MATIHFDTMADVPKWNVMSDKSNRLVYVMKDFTVVDPYFVRPDSTHDSYDDAIAAAVKFVDAK